VEKTSGAPTRPESLRKKVEKCGKEPPNPRQNIRSKRKMEKNRAGGGGWEFPIKVPSRWKAPKFSLKKKNEKYLSLIGEGEGKGEGCETDAGDGFQDPHASLKIMSENAR